MFNEFMKDKDRLWQICFNVRRAKQSHIDSHVMNVSSNTMEGAIAKIHAEFDDAKIRSVNHKGEIHL